MNHPTADIHATIETELSKWVQQFMVERRAALQRGKRGVATGDALNSFQIEQQVREEGVQLVMAFNDSIRFLDMKGSSFHHDVWGRNAMNRLMDWINQRGLENFLNGKRGYLSKYPNMGLRKGLNINRIVSNIAWGIAHNRTHGFIRRKKVWNAAKTAGIHELVNDVAASLPKTTSDTITRQFNTKGYARAY